MEEDGAAAAAAVAPASAAPEECGMPTALRHRSRSPGKCTSLLSGCSRTSVVYRFRLARCASFSSRVSATNNCCTLGVKSASATGGPTKAAWHGGVDAAAAAAAAAAAPGPMPLLPPVSAVDALTDALNSINLDDAPAGGAAVAAAILPAARRHTPFLQCSEMRGVEFLSKPFDPALKTRCALDWEYSARLADGRKQVIPRFNHGLAHTVRVAALVPVAYRLLQLARGEVLTEQDDLQLRRAQYCMLFAVIGRQCEISFFDGRELYAAFKATAQNALRRHLTQHAPRSLEWNEADAEEWISALDVGKPNSANTTLNCAMGLAHDADLMRCRKWTGTGEAHHYFGPKFLHFCSEFAGNGQSGVRAAQQLMDYARLLLVVTGDRVWGHADGPAAGGDAIVDKTFYQCSTDVDKCFEAILSVPPPICMRSQLRTGAPMTEAARTSIANEATKLARDFLRQFQHEATPSTSPVAPSFAAYVNTAPSELVSSLPSANWASVSAVRCMSGSGSLRPWRTSTRRMNCSAR